jgi:hypothetical protein
VEILPNIASCSLPPGDFLLSQHYVRLTTSFPDAYFFIEYDTAIRRATIVYRIPLSTVENDALVQSTLLNLPICSGRMRCDTHRSQNSHSFQSIALFFDESLSISASIEVQQIALEPSRSHHTMQKWHKMRQGQSQKYADPMEKEDMCIKDIQYSLTTSLCNAINS